MDPEGSTSTTFWKIYIGKPAHAHLVFSACAILKRLFSCTTHILYIRSAKDNVQFAIEFDPGWLAKTMSLSATPSDAEVAAVKLDMADVRAAMQDKYGDSMDVTLAKVADAKYR